MTPRSANGEGDSKRKYESTDPPWVPVVLRMTRRGFPEDMVVCEKNFEGSEKNATIFSIPAELFE